MNNIELVLNKSYGDFIIGDDISNYLHKPHEVILSKGDPEAFDYRYYDSYYFDDTNFAVWVQNGKIETICCSIECFWQGKNLIKMPYEEFLTLVDQQPDDEEDFYVPLSRNKGQNQKCYTFSELGLMVWVWRKKIVTVLISKDE